MEDSDENPQGDRCTGRFNLPPALSQWSLAQASKVATTEPRAQSPPAPQPPNQQPQIPPPRPTIPHWPPLSPAGPQYPTIPDARNTSPSTATIGVHVACPQALHLAPLILSTTAPEHSPWKVTLPPTTTPLLPPSPLAPPHFQNQATRGEFAEATLTSCHHQSLLASH